LDYETLKPRFQIEAVYEEEGHRQRLLVPEDDNDDGGQRKGGIFEKISFWNPTRTQRMHPSTTKNKLSFQDESPGDLEQPAIPKQVKPSLSYSHEATSSDEESMSQDGSAVSESFSTWTTWDKTKTASSETSLEPKQEKNPESAAASRHPLIGHDDDALASHKQCNDRYLSAGNEDSSNREDRKSSSILNVPFKRTSSKLPHYYLQQPSPCWFLPQLSIW
jgi:hypothetical protein